MTLLTSRLARLVGTCMAAGALTLSGPLGTAVADGMPQGPTPTTVAPADSGPRIVRVHMKNSGFTLPKSIHAGFITFRATTSDPGGHALQGIQLRHGVTLAQVVQQFKLVVSQNPAVSAPAIRALSRDITAVGGPTVDPATTVSDTIPLTAGTYYFFDFNDFFAPGGNPRIHTLRVYGRFDDDVPRYGAVITQIDTKAGPRFVAPSHLDTDSTVLIRNHAPELHEAIFQRVVKGTTDAKLQTVFNAILQGKQPPFNPFAEQGNRGVGAMSPGRIQLLRFDPKGGLYALQCFVPDDQSGIPHAFLGMHKVMRLR
jgi:hypothetical protein